MTVREQVTGALDGLTEGELEQVVEYLATLKSHSQSYTQHAQDDRHLAEAEMTEYSERLLVEDKAATVTQFKIVVEKHADGYVAYPLDLKGAVVGEGDTYEAALADVKSAIRFHIETFGKQVLEAEPLVLEAFVAEVGVVIGQVSR
jgi:predicted RNase H-like HicB family nuclease